MIDRATGMLNTGRSVPSQVTRRSFSPRDCAARVRLRAGLVVEVVHHAHRGHDDLAGRQRGDHRTADPPVPAERPDGRLDHAARPAQEAVPLLLLVRGLRIVRIVEGGPNQDRHRQNQRPGTPQNTQPRSAMRNSTVRGDGHL